MSKVGHTVLAITKVRKRKQLAGLLIIVAKMYTQLLDIILGVCYEVRGQIVFKLNLEVWGPY